MGKNLQVIKGAQPNTPLITCKFKENEQFVFVDFGHITKQKRYGYNALIDKQKDDRQILKSLLTMIVEMSNSTWAELAHREKDATGGYETIGLSQFKTKIWDQFDSKLTNDVKLYVFRFGNGNAYRMIGYKSDGCRHAIHILGFDLDYSLYNHGN